MGAHKILIFDGDQPLPERSWLNLTDVAEFVNGVSPLAPASSSSAPASQDTPHSDSASPSHTTPKRLGIAYLDQPSPAVIAAMARDLDLSPLLVEDLLKGAQRPKLERHDDAVFMVLSRPLYDDALETVEFTELHVVVVGHLCVIIRHNGVDGPNWLSRNLTPSRDNLREGVPGVLYTVLDQVVDAAMPVVRGIHTDLEQVERQVFTGDSAAPERIYRLFREVIDLQRSMGPISEIIEDLDTGFFSSEPSEQLRSLLEDISDHHTRVASQLTDFRDLLTQILSVNATLVDQRRNEDMKAVSSWGAILIVPTLIGSIYGMNFDDMPELHWQYGYYGSIGLMILLSGLLYIIFKYKDWL